MSDLSMRSAEGQVTGTGHAVVGTSASRTMHYWGGLWNSCHLLQAQVWLRKCSRSLWWGLESSVLRWVLSTQRRKLSVVSGISREYWHCQNLIQWLHLMPKYMSENQTFLITLLAVPKSTPHLSASCCIFSLTSAQEPTYHSLFF